MKSLVLRSAALAITLASPAAAQTQRAEGAVLKRIWQIGMEQSRVEQIAQPLIDSIGPRLTGSPTHEGAHDWAVKMLRNWGITARKEQYGTSKSWQPGWVRGETQIDLVQPRVRSLEGTAATWSPGTQGPTQGPVVIIPEYRNHAEFEAWLRTVRGKFVATSFPQPTCRPDAHYTEYGTPGALERMRTARDSARAAFQRRVPQSPFFAIQLEEAGALGILESSWNRDIGVNGTAAANTSRTPVIDLSCEDYGLIYRLAANKQRPVLRLNVQSQFLGEVPLHNTIAEIRGRELPNEYVMLSAHMDSWDAASGATDNGTGVAVMLEALRILKEAYPNPKRTILLGLWGGEEVGPWGSSAFVAANPEIVKNLQVLFNQDSGTGRIVEISDQGIVGATPFLSSWIARVPREIGEHITLKTPGLPAEGGSDHFAFTCAGAPGINLRSASWSYDPHTWHTNRDTYDKIVFEEVRSNATLIAMLAYLASEDPDRVSRERRAMPLNPQGQPMPWPSCGSGTPSVIAAAEVRPGHSLRADLQGPYIDNTARVISRVALPLVLCTVQGVCATQAFPRTAPAQSSPRALVLDLSRPVTSSGATNRGVIRSSASVFTSFWTHRSQPRSVHEIPVDSSVVSERTEVRFIMDGGQHVLQFGHLTEGGITGQGTTPGVVRRVSDSRWTIRSPANSVGRLWNTRDPANPKDLGLYRFTYDVLFRMAPKY